MRAKCILKVFQDATYTLERMVIKEVLAEPAQIEFVPSAVDLEELQAGVRAVQPKSFGQRAMTTYNVQKVLTVDKLKEIHSSLKSCPTETDFKADPKGLTTALMPHQQQALVWMESRELLKPSGGILADDMGLGKTLTMISLVLQSDQQEQDQYESENDENDDEEPRYKYYGDTIVVCPASLLSQ